MQGRSNAVTTFATGCNLTGGATAVLLGWRVSTIDVDLKLEGGAETVLRAVPRIKEEMQINVELASPSDFIPELPGWRDRSLYITPEGRLDFYHFDLYSQALAKIQRGHVQDLEDVRQMMVRALSLNDPVQLVARQQLVRPAFFNRPRSPQTPRPLWHPACRQSPSRFRSQGCVPPTGRSSSWASDSACSAFDSRRGIEGPGSHRWP